LAHDLDEEQDHCKSSRGPDDHLGSIPHDPRMLICSEGDDPKADSRALADRLGFLSSQSTTPPPLRVCAKNGFGQLVTCGRSDLNRLVD
jgi:hypothetical protein